MNIEVVGSPLSPTLILYHGEEDFSDQEGFFKEKGAFFVRISGNNWERDFTPYPEKKVFHGGRDFLGGAPEYLEKFTKEIYPEIIKHFSLAPKRVVLAGYSLAGLFALYASQDPLFTDIASVSGSLWFPGYIEKLKEQKIFAKNIYLSLGDRESKSKSAVLQTALQAQEEALEELLKRGKNATFVLENGGHFSDPKGRVLRGLDWILNQPLK